MDAATLQAIGTLISGVGFPAVMAILLFQYMKEQTKAHEAESRDMRDAINELKVAITTLTTKLGQ